MMLKGSLWALLQFDVSEEIQLDQVRALIGAESRAEIRRRPSPESVKFTQPPVSYPLEPVLLPGGAVWSSVFRCYDYGVISICLELPFAEDWAGLVELASRWIGSQELERRAAELAKMQVKRLQAALRKPGADWTFEDYYVIHAHEALDDAGAPLPARDLIETYGGYVAQVVRGESAELSDAERKEALNQWLSYYPSDLLVIGWTAAFVYDSAEGAAPVLQLLEYANTQLLEFRYYDDWLTGVLAEVHRSLEKRRGVFGRWRIAAQAERLNRMRLDVIELTERIDNSVKFLSDMFFARVYHLAARKIGVNDYRFLVDEKLKTVGDLYEAMVSEFHQSRAFLLELAVVAILIVELVFLFRGKG
jgi:hypothetical protein